MESVSTRANQAADAWAKGADANRAGEGSEKMASGVGPNLLGFIPKGLPKTLVGRFHRLGHAIMRGQGFRFEVHQSGATRVGFWKKTLNAPESEAATNGIPRRLVLIPGLGDAAVSWLPILSALRVVVKGQVDEICILEFPGYMGSLKEEPPIESFDQMLSHAHDVLDRLRPEILVGHSLGAWISTHYSVECSRGARPAQKTMGYTGPERVVLIAPPGIERNESMVKSWGEIFYKATELGYEFLRPHTFGKEPKWFSLIVPSLEDFFRRKEMHAFIRSIGDKHFLGPKELASLRSELWVIFAEHDSLAQVSELDEWLKATQPMGERAHGVVMRGIGHSPHIEAPVVTAAILGQILRRKKLSDRGKRWWEVRHAA